MPNQMPKFSQVSMRMAAPTVNDDASMGYTYGWLWIWYDPENGKRRTYICLDATDGAALWHQVDIGTLGSATDVPAGTMLWSWADGSRSSILVNANTYKVYGTAPYIGANYWTPDTLVITARMAQTGVTGTVRVYDVDNSQTVALITVNTDTKDIYTMNTANLPNGMANFELQAKRDDSTNMDLFAAGLFNLNP